MSSNEAKDSLKAVNYLCSLRSQGSKYGLDRMRALVRVLGHPEREFPVIHVAGTNGKGSVCAMLEAALRRAGAKVGMLTSPHLVRLGERIQINRQVMTDEEITSFVEQLKPVSEKLAADDPEDHPSFFELITAIGFLSFAREKVDVAVVETGLGGRLDATNVVDPILSVITSVGLDHVAQLGSDLASIAWEKAGIVKPTVPIVVGRMPLEAQAVIRQVAEERQAEIHEVEAVFPEAPLDLPETNLKGTFQRWNAGSALVATQVLGARFELADSLVREALLEVDWAGRWQRLQMNGRILILDATHNEEGASSLNENLEELVKRGKARPWVVAGTLGEERANALMGVVAKWARGITLLQPNQPRACSFDILESALPNDFLGEIRRSTVEELFPGGEELALGKPGDVVVVTGSIYLVGEVLTFLRGQRSPGGMSALQDWV
ncbi:MAG: bifunctional folylpolyglutamate synthase/dihydrofolate synthase [Opitutales bacterium]|nr:bifunctional folylpolyglutamate synthase/dihydrofolate synthase [Opitutales bacterium]|tara:strand:- start:325 stop:1635 length:1311 start_codon:yes stop_codon:yes gene_type:complete